MITMLHYDALHNPVPNDKLLATQHKNYLDKHTYEFLSDEEIEHVRNVVLFSSIRYRKVFDLLSAFTFF